jgi:L-threonylcarbamoyladenylate synthase
MPLILRVDPRDPDAAVVGQAAEMIRDGLIVAYPTDTLYGLGVDPRNAAAVRRLFDLKGRPETSALTLVAADVAQAREAGRWWPGPLTVVLDAAAGLAGETLAGGRTVGIRVPDHPVAVALARGAGFCVTATSANRSGATAASTPEAVAEALPNVDAILDAGPSPGGRPSTIVNAATRDVTLVRAGVVPWDRVLRSIQ